MSWTLLDPKPHVPQVLSEEGLEEIRLLGLYPNAADLLATLDAALDENERLRKECDEERAAYLNASHERDALRAYAVAVTEAARVVVDDTDNWRQGGLDVKISELREALAKDPAQPALGSLSSPQTGAQPERHETGTKSSFPSPVEAWQAGMERAAELCEEERESARALLNDNPHIGAMAKDRVSGIRNAMDMMAGTIRTFKDAGPDMDELRHQSCTESELHTAATALYKWLVAVPFQEPPMKRFSIPDEVWEPFQDALFDSQFVACTKPRTTLELAEDFDRRFEERHGEAHDFDPDPFFEAYRWGYEFAIGKTP